MVWLPSDSVDLNEAHDGNTAQSAKQKADEKKQVFVH
jgi:hypothetical protein